MEKLLLELTHTVLGVCVCVLNGVDFPHEGVIKMAAFSQHVGTTPEGRSRLIQRSKTQTAAVCVRMHVHTLREY